MAVRARKPKAAKIDVRVWFRAAIVLSPDVPGRAVISPLRGATVIEVNLETLERTEREEPQKLLVANLGDQMLVCGPGVDEMAFADVVRVEQDGWKERLMVDLGDRGGVFQTTTRSVMVQKLRRPI